MHLILAIILDITTLLRLPISAVTFPIFFSAIFFSIKVLGGKNTQAKGGYEERERIRKLREDNLLVSNVNVYNFKADVPVDERDMPVFTTYIWKRSILNFDSKY
jgi:hypothetical protein